MNSVSTLRRSMSLVHATAMVVGIILGASIFIQPSEITRLVPNARGLMLVWLAAGALTFCGAMVCAELAAVFPDTGGVYVFLKNIFSPAAGFLWGWGMFWSMHSGIIAAIAVILARYVGYFIPLSEAAVRTVAISAVLLLSLVNYLGVKPGSALQVVLTAAKVGAIGVLVAVLFAFGRSAHVAIGMQGASSDSASPGAYGLAIGAGLFAFGGWHMVTYAAGETRDPRRTIPRALLIGTLVVTACYMLLNGAYLYVMPLSQVANSARVAAEATERVLGARAGGAIAIAVIVSALGALNGIILAGPRVYYAMAGDGLAFRWLGAVHPRRQTPYLAIAAQAAWSCVLVATNSYRELFTRVVYTEWLFFALLAAGLFVLRRKAAYSPGGVMARGYPVVPLLFIVASVGIALNQIRANPGNSIAGLALLLAGLPVYFFWSQKAGKNAHH
ncbi:MAG TPA: amino acid permease [Candidatus Limnocylindrales bacterium]|nr:amino acid permease [Candidatus Limnocylindrales bacterium]